MTAPAVAARATRATRAARAGIEVTGLSELTGFADSGRRRGDDPGPDHHDGPLMLPPQLPAQHLWSIVARERKQGCAGVQDGAGGVHGTAGWVRGTASRRAHRASRWVIGRTLIDGASVEGVLIAATLSTCCSVSAASPDGSNHERRLPACLKLS